MQRTAVFWIRDGVLINRMPVNAVSFAFAAITYGKADVVADISLTELVNFAFQTSGISCAEKMHKFNQERLPLIDNVQEASSYYNQLAGQAAVGCSYFAGINDLLCQLRQCGALNFVTSAVEQSVLDDWSQSAQGTSLMGSIEAVLGRRQDGFVKGRPHFAYALQNYGIRKIYYVADAVSEIANGTGLAQEFNIFPVGFANVICGADVERAYQLVLATQLSLVSARARVASEQSKLEQLIAGQSALNQAQLQLPNAETLSHSLTAAGAVHVVQGATDTIVTALADYFAASL